jgi:hypothetical protein
LLEQDPARQLDVPVRGQKAAGEQAEANHVRWLPLTRIDAQERVLVALWRGGTGKRCVQPGGVGGQLVAHVGVQRSKLGDRRAVYADQAQRAIDTEHLGSDHFCQSALNHAQLDLELASAVLGVTKAEAEPGVGFVARVDVGHPVRVTADREIAPQANRKSARNLR